MSADAEQTFARNFLNILSRQPVTYSDDYQQPLQNSLKKVPVFQIPVPPLPERTNQPASGSSSEVPLTLHVKSLKLKSTYTLTVSPSDTILSIKSKLHTMYPTKVPVVEGQSILLGGKALSDQRMLGEYVSAENKEKGGVNVNLMEKKIVAGVTPTATSTPTLESENLKEEGGTIEIVAPLLDPTTPNLFSGSSSSLDPHAKPTGGHKRHQRIPSVVLSPSPSIETTSLPTTSGITIGTGSPVSPNGGGGGSGTRTPEPMTPKEILLDLNEPDGLGLGLGLAGVAGGGSEVMGVGEKYRETVKKPEFWEGLVGYLRTQFQTESDVHLAFEDFLGVTKGYLTASEIAKIRDWVGVLGMAGT